MLGTKLEASPCMILLLDTEFCTWMPASSYAFFWRAVLIWSTVRSLIVSEMAWVVVEAGRTVMKRGALVEGSTGEGEDLEVGGEVPDGAVQHLHLVTPQVTGQVTRDRCR